MAIVEGKRTSWATQTISLKPEVLEIIKQEAENNGRKVSQEIAWRLKRTLKEDGKI